MQGFHIIVLLSPRLITACHIVGVSQMLVDLTGSDGSASSILPYSVSLVTSRVHL